MLFPLWGGGFPCPLPLKQMELRLVTRPVLCSVIAAVRKDAPASSSSPTDPDEVFLNNLDILPRLSYYLQRALVRIAREAQRLSKQVGKCGRQEVKKEQQAKLLRQIEQFSRGSI